MSAVTTQARNLPSATLDMEQAKSDLDTFGYCLIATALSGVALEKTRTRLLEQAAAEEANDLDFRDGGKNQDLVDGEGRLHDDAFKRSRGGINQRLWMLANKGKCFRDLVVDPLVDELVGHVLGPDFLLSTLSANIAKPGGMRMGLHTDQWWMPQPVKPGSNYVKPSALTRMPEPNFIEPDPTLGIAPAVVVNTMWMLNDFDADNGSTELVPGSHLSGAHPRPGDQADYEIVQPEGPAGTLMVFDGRLWHGTGANTSDRERIGVLVTFCAPQFRQQENQVLGFDRALWDEVPEKLKSRMGFKVWNAYGRIESPRDTWIDPDPTRIGELKP